MTFDELAALALRVNKIVGQGQTASADDTTLVKQQLTLAHAELAQYDLQTWDLSNTPDAYAHAFIEYAKPLIGAIFEMAQQQGIVGQRPGLAKLSEIVNPRRLRMIQKNEYY